MNRTYVIMVLFLATVFVLGCVQNPPASNTGTGPIGAEANDPLAQEASTIASDFSDADAQALEDELLQDFGQ